MILKISDLKDNFFNKKFQVPVDYLPERGTRYKENNRNGIIKPLVILVDFSNNSPVDNHQYSKEQFASILFDCMKQIYTIKQYEVCKN